jgi:hypothetical protein
MRITYTSDLHIDAEHNRPVVEAIAERMSRLSPDVIVVAGDAGNTITDLHEALTIFESIPAARYFVAGNHDVWIESGDSGTIESREKLDVHIPHACRQHGFHDLHTGPDIFDAVAFVGTLGWYDYTFADPRMGLTEDDCWKGLWGDEKWWDREMVLWRPRGGGEQQRDPEICRELNGRLADHIAAVGGYDVIAVVHTLPFLDTLPRSEPPYYLDAFTGAARLGETLLACPRLKTHIGGHKHLVGDWRIGHVNSHRRPLGRVAADADIAATADAALGVVEL